MWIILAFASAFFAGVMSILAKIGIRDTDPDLATALRTVVVAFFAWIIVFIVGSHMTITDVDIRSIVFLVLSGFATGGTWLCYLKALKLGDVNKVVPINKTSTVLTMLLSMLFLGEGFTVIKFAAMALIGIGTYFMIEQKKIVLNEANTKRSFKWIVYAALSAVFASLTAILGKIGIEGVESNLGTAIRTIVVLVMAWGIVFAQGRHKEIKQINRKSWLFLGLSGLATGLSWLCFYSALQQGPVSVVIPIDKLSIVVTIAFSYFILREKLKKMSVLGLVLIVIGTLSLLI
ncbi:MAG: EamA family transporter [Oscillospiraceae bacterium]|nr:EamA family transporter [Oscillospiraceae bacterium]